MSKNQHINTNFNPLIRIFVLLIISIILIDINNYVSAQKSDSHITNDIKHLFNKAKQYQKKGEYYKANDVYREMIDMSKMLPSEFAFYFAITLYHTEQYHNANSFIKKYIDLSGVKGDYYNEAKDLEKKIKDKLSVISNCQLCDKFGYQYKTCHICKGVGTHINDCYSCRGVGSIICPKCRGEGVEIVKNALQVNEYRTCSRCKLKRYITCPICEGHKMLTQDCELCLGKGKEVTQQICNHIE